MFEECLRVSQKQRKNKNIAGRVRVWEQAIGNMVALWRYQFGFAVVSVIKCSQSKLREMAYIVWDKAADDSKHVSIRSGTSLIGMFRRTRRDGYSGS